MIKKDTLMRKFTYLVLLLFAFTTDSYSQLVFTRDGNVINENSLIYEKEVDDLGAIPAHVKIKNTGNKSIQAGLTVTVLEEPIGAMAVGYCGWGSNQCMPVGFGSPHTRTTTLREGDEIDPVIEAMGVEEENTLVKVQYKLSYEGTESLLYVNFAAGLSSIDNNKLQNPLKIIMNNGVPEILYNFNSGITRELKVYDLTGKLVLAYVITDQKGAFSLHKLNKGIYFCSVNEQGKTITTTKFIVH